VQNKDNVLKQLSRIYCVEKSGDGFTAGLYLFVYAELFLKQLVATSGGNKLISAGGVSASAETWAVGLLVPMTLLIAMLEVPSGYLADWRGPRFAVTTAWIFRSLFFAVFYCGLALATSADAVVVLAYSATIPFAIGYTLRSGANQTWLHWALAQHECSSKEIEEYRNSINSRSWSMYWIASLAGSMFSILTYTVSPFVVFGTGFAICVSVSAYLRLYMANYEANETDSAESNSSTSNETVLSLNGFDHWQLAARWITIIVVAGATGIFMILADLVDHTWLIVCKSYLQSEVTAYHESMLVLATGVAAIIGSGASAWVDSKTESYSSFRSVLLFAIVAALFGAPHVLVGQYPGIMTLVAFLFIKELVRGAFDGPKENLINGLIPSKNKYRATLISGVNQVGNLMVACVAIYFFVADKTHGEAGRLIGTWVACGVALIVSAFCVLVIAIWAAAIYKPTARTRESGDERRP
jgi:hypothetical protein